MTGCERVLAALRGGPKHEKELYRLTDCIVHSRVAELRRRGYLIEHDKRTRAYRLLSEPPNVPTASGSESSPPPRPAAAFPSSAAAGHPQLTLL